MRKRQFKKLMKKDFNMTPLEMEKLCESLLKFIKERQRMKGQNIK